MAVQFRGGQCAPRTRSGRQRTGCAGGAAHRGGELAGRSAPRPPPLPLGHRAADSWHQRRPQKLLPVWRDLRECKLPRPRRSAGRPRWAVGRPRVGRLEHDVADREGLGISGLVRVQDAEQRLVLQAHGLCSRWLPVLLAKRSAKWSRRRTTWEPKMMSPLCWSHTHRTTFSPAAVVPAALQAPSIGGGGGGGGVTRASSSSVCMIAAPSSVPPAAPLSCAASTTGSGSGSDRSMWPACLDSSASAGWSATKVWSKI